MAELDNTIVKGKLVVTDETRMVAPMTWADSTALPSKTLQYVLGIDGFAAGGETGWQSKSDFLGTDVVKTAANQDLSDIQKANAKANIGVEDLPAHTSSNENYVLSVDSSGNLVWKAPYDGTASGS